MTMNAATLTRHLNAHARAAHSNRVAERPSLLQEWFARWQLRRRIRRDEAWLLLQPDYLLRDIGLERSEIATMVRRGDFR